MLTHRIPESNKIPKVLASLLLPQSKDKLKIKIFYTATKYIHFMDVKTKIKILDDIEFKILHVVHALYRGLKCWPILSPGIKSPKPMVVSDIKQ